MVSVAERTPDRAALVQASLLVGSSFLLVAAVVAGRGVQIVATATLLLALGVALRGFLTRWPTLVGTIVLIILFIPIRRYSLGGGLPLDLEPYRIVVAAVILLWIGTMLVDRRVRLRSSFLDPPLLLFGLAVVGSIVTNTSTIAESVPTFFRDSFIEKGDVSSDVLKKVLFLASFYFVFYFVVSVVRDVRAVHAVLKTLVLGCTAVALAGIYEARTGYNIFDQLQGVVPGLSFEGGLRAVDIARGGRLRVYASAEHPIALAGLLVMLLPISIYLARHTGRKRWALCSLVIGLGALSTVSRTSVTMLAAVVVVFLALRPVQVKRLWPLVLPAVVVVHIALPGTIGGLQGAFFPSTGLIQDQSVYGGRVSASRLAPEIARIKSNPVFGRGFGSRVTESGLRKNASVLDDEWLGLTAETGFVGLFAWVWFFGRVIRRAGDEAKRDLSSRGWLLSAVTASVTSFAVGMLTYDAFSFVQVTFVLFIVAALGAVALKLEPWPSETRGDAASARLPGPAREIP
jgi:polysaccharide biosynthesis protein PslJ